MKKQLDYSKLTYAGYGKRSLAFFLFFIVCVLLMILFYFTIGEYAISRPLGYAEKMEHLSSLVEESGLADEEGMGYAFPALDEEGNLGADRYKEIVWDYYYSVLPESRELGFLEDDGFSGDESNPTDVGEWIYRHVYGYGEEGFYERFAEPSSFEVSPSYSAAVIEGLEGDDKEAVAEDLLSFYYSYADGRYGGAYVEAFAHFQSQPAYYELFDECSDIIYFKTMPSYAASPLIVFIVLPFCLKGRTLGKLIFGLYITDKNGQKAAWWKVLIHYGFISICFMLPLIPGGGMLTQLAGGFAMLLDFIVLLISKSRRSIHEFIAGTRVMRLAKDGEMASIDFASSEEEEEKEGEAGEQEGDHPSIEG